MDGARAVWVAKVKWELELNRRARPSVLGNLPIRQDSFHGKEIAVGLRNFADPIKMWKCCEGVLCSTALDPGPSALC